MEDIPIETLTAGVALLWGLLWGSFLNVVIHRLPHGQSLLRPPSHCPACSQTIRPWHNIPVLSWILLKGRCGSCSVPISPRYPIVEGVTGLLSAAVWTLLLHSAGRNWDWSGDLAALIGPFLLVFALVCALVSITFIDLDLQIIPHSITLPFILLGPLSTFWLEPFLGVHWSTSILGAIVGGGIIWLVIEVYFRIRKREGMGGGDFMMLAMLGSWLGIESIVFILLASSIQGLMAAGIFVLGGGQPAPPLHLQEEGVEEVEGIQYMAVPFGPFLALAGLEWLFFRPWILEFLYGAYGIDG